MRIMGIDYGESRVGIAVSDPFGWTAQGVASVKWQGNNNMLMDKIREIIQQYGVEKIVVGFPVNMNGTIGPRGERTEEFIDLLKRRFDIEVVKWDERLSTVAANRTMHEIGTKTSKKKGLVDQIAAVYILQGYLDSLGK